MSNPTSGDQYAKLRKELQYWKDKYSELAATQEKKVTTNKKHNQLLDNIDILFNSNPDYVKSLVSSGKISMDDVDKRKSTLLTLAAEKGRYDIAQLCINLGADIDHVDITDRTPIWYD